MENVNNSGHILNEDHRPSFFQNSCMGNTSEEEKTVGEIPENVDRVNEHVNDRPSKVQGEIGWVKTLKCFPILTNEILDNHLIKGSSTGRIVSTGPKAFRNKKQGYRLWKRVTLGTCLKRMKLRMSVIKDPLPCCPLQW